MMTSQANMIQTSGEYENFILKRNKVSGCPSYLVSVALLCDLQGLFSQINNLPTVNRIEWQLMSI